MPDLLDIRVTELLCARLCHELASPVGAINNGIEMIQEFDESMLPDAMPLIGSSASLVAERLKFYRMAYGRAGTTSIIADSEVRELAEGFLSDGRSSLDWPEGTGIPAWSEGWGKLVLNLLPFATETLPRGGTICIGFDDSTESVQVSIIAKGEGARVPEECHAALDSGASVEQLTPRSVHVYFLARLAERMSTRVEVNDSVSGQTTLSIRLAR
jgi:histidine phosphotransferase ChpT